MQSFIWFINFSARELENSNISSGHKVRKQLSLIGFM